MLKESLDRLWNYRYEGAMLSYLQRWMDQLRWQRLRPFEKLADMRVKHLDGILNYCRTKVPLGMVEAINGNIKSLLRRGRGIAISATYCSKLNAWRQPGPNLWLSGEPPKNGPPVGFWRRANKMNDSGQSSQNAARSI